MNIALRRQSWVLLLIVSSLVGVLIIVTPMITFPVYFASFQQACFSAITMLSRMDTSFVIGYGVVFALLVLSGVAALYALYDEVSATMRLRAAYAVRTYQHQSDISYIHDTVPYAITIGFCKPRIFISSALVEICTAREREVIIAHERAHQRNKDSLVRLLVRVATAFLWWIPLRQHFKWIIVAIQEQRANEGLDKEVIQGAVYKILHNQFASGTTCAFHGTTHRLIEHDRITLAVSMRTLVMSVLIVVGLWAVTSMVHAKDQQVRSLIQPQQEGYCQALFWTTETSMSQIPMSTE